MDKISLAITTFNRSDLTIASFIQVMDNAFIDEIMIVDDCSDINIFMQLNQLIANLNNDKIKLYRNEANLKPFFNKYEAVKGCKNDWVILLDSDNIINNDYLKVIEKIDKESNVLYCPSILHRLGSEGDWNYGEFSGLIVDKNNVKEYFGRYNNFDAFMNTGNSFLNRKKYIEVIESSEIDPVLSVNDALYLSYLWLLHGNKMIAVPNLGYIHRIHTGSWYQNNFSACGQATERIKKKLEYIDKS
jgi:hypothetical protein